MCASIGPSLDFSKVYKGHGFNLQKGCNLILFIISRFGLSMHQGYNNVKLAWPYQPVILLGVLIIDICILVHYFVCHLRLQTIMLKIKYIKNVARLLILHS